MDKNDTIDTLANFIVEAKIGYLATTTKDGEIVSRPLSIPQKEYSGQVWHLTHKDANKIAQIAANPQVNLSFNVDTAWVSIAGKAEVVQDTNKIHELWTPLNETFFDGPDDPNICLIKITPSGAEYWNMTNGKVTSLLRIVKAAVTHQKEAIGQK